MAGASVEQIEDLVDIAISECERFYPAFQLVVWGGKPADEAIAAAMIEPDRRGVNPGGPAMIAGAVVLVGCGQMGGPVARLARERSGPSI